MCAAAVCCYSVSLLPSQARSSADSFHGQADAFETTFERSYSAFQLHCRGARILCQSLLRQQQDAGRVEGDPCPDDPDASNDADAAAAATAGCAAGGGFGCGSTPASDARDMEEGAETHLLRTLGAQLVELVTTRECEKMVRRHSIPPP